MRRPVVDTDSSNEGSSSSTPAPVVPETKPQSHNRLALSAVDGVATDSTCCCIGKLPNEMIAHIFSFLPIKTRFRTALRVCKRWRLIVLNTPLSPPLLSLQNFHASFKETIWSCIDGDGDISLEEGLCETTEEVEAVAAFLTGNGEIAGWNHKIM